MVNRQPAVGNDFLPGFVLLFGGRCVTSRYSGIRSVRYSAEFVSSGKLNKELIFKQYGDKTVVSKYPDMSKRELSPKQLKAQEVMWEANYYAKGIMFDEELSKAPLLRLNVTRNKLYTALVKEYFKTQKEKNGAE